MRPQLSGDLTAAHTGRSAGTLDAGLATADGAHRRSRIRQEGAPGCDGPSGERSVAPLHRFVTTRRATSTEPASHGAVVAPPTADREPRPVGADARVGTWEVAWSAGPDAGAAVRLPPGRWLVGRAPQAHVRCADPALEPFHVRLTLWPHGEVVVHQLAGRHPVRHDGRTVELGASSLHVRQLLPPLGGSAAAAGTALPPGRGGPSPAGEPPAVAATDPESGPEADAGDHGPRPDPGPAVTVVRPARVVPRWEPPPVPDPPSLPEAAPAPAAAGLLVSSGAGAVAAVVVATLLGQPLLAVLALVGVVVAASSAAVERVRHVRRRRRDLRRHAEAVARHASATAAAREAFAAHRRATVPTLADALRVAREGSAERWVRRRHHPDAFDATLGVGTVPFAAPGGTVPFAAPGGTVPFAAPGGTVPFAAPGGGREDLLDGLPVTVALGTGARVALTGPHAEALARSLLVQLATTTGPADWRLVVASIDAERWGWLRGLPHLDGAGGAAGAEVVAHDGPALLELVRTRSAPGVHRAHTVVVTDDVAGLGVRTSALRRWSAAEPELALVVVDPRSGITPPAVCTALVVTTVDGGARYAADVVAGAAPHRLRVTGAGAAAAAAHVALLARWRDPEDPRLDATGLGAAVTLGELLGGAATPAEVMAGWRALPADASPATPIGRAVDGTVEVDLVRDGPHALVAGTTGAGKSELLRSLVVGTCTGSGPDRVTFVLIDFKGGAAFDGCSRLPHVVGTVTDLDGPMVARVLRSLQAELAHREHVLRRHGAADLDEARRRSGTPVVPRLVVVVDEFAALAAEHPAALDALLGIAQRGRSLGLHLVLATQRPHGVISDDIRSNTNLRIALRLHDPADAADVVADPLPATFPRAAAGRAAMRLGPDELVLFQAARCDDIDQRVDAVVAAAAAAGLPPPRRPWLDPLPRAVTSEQVPDGALGLIDLPDQQAQVPLRWQPADGHLLVLGAHGTGVTSTLHTLALAVLGRGAELLVVDGRGDERWAAAATHPGCAGVARPHQRELLVRLLRRALASPAGGPGPSPTSVVVVVDGLGVLRACVDEVEREEERVLVQRLATDLPAGVVLVVGAERAAGVPPALAALFSHRWLLHVHDRHDAHLLGVPLDAVPPPLPGRIAVVGPGGAVDAAQVVAPATGGDVALRLPPVTHRAAPLRTLADVVDPVELPPSTADGDTVSLVLGRSYDTLDPLVVEVPDGEHLLVVGPVRSGRSSALSRVAAAWHEARPGTAVVAVAPRRSPLRAAAHHPAAAVDLVEQLLADDSPVLLAVDDAELVDDPGGRLAMLLERRPPGLLVAAAGRPDALRQAYGHWTTHVRRSRRGVVLTGCTELDGDLLGACVPRRSPLPARPGLGWVVADGTVQLAQLALGVGSDASLPVGSGRRVSCTR